MGDLDGYLVNNTYPTHFSATYNIGSTGSFNLMFGSSDAGDTLEPSDLIVHSVSVQVPAGAYTIQGSGVRLGDGTLLQSDGSALSPGGVLEPSLLSDSASLLISTLNADASSGLIGQDGNGLIGEDGSSIVAQGGGNVVSNDGGSVVSNDGGSLIGEDGSSLLARRRRYRWR